MNEKAFVFCENIAFDLVAPLNSEETFLLCQFVGEMKQEDAFDRLMARTGNEDTLKAALAIAGMSAYYFSAGSFRSYIQEVVLPVKKNMEDRDVAESSIT